jgi:hypothetical protein
MINASETRNKRASEKLATFKLEAQKVQAEADRKSGFHPFGHYFLWVCVSVGGKRVYKLCVGSGCAQDAGEEACRAVSKLEGVTFAWSNLD